MERNKLFAQISVWIATADASELGRMQGLSNRRFKELMKAEDEDVKSDFKIGDQVVFGRPNGEKRFGQFSKINAKTVKVVATDDRVWNVAPSLIKICTK